MSQQINLYNPAFQKKERPFSVRTMSVSLGLLAAGLVALYGFAAVQTRSAERAAAQLGEQLKAQREQLATLSKVPVRMPAKALEAELAKLEAEVKARQTTLQALGTGELGNTGGFSEFLAALGRQAIPGVWLTSVTIGESGNQLLVQGRALRAELMPAFLRALNKEPVMRGRRVTEMKLSAKSDDRKQAFVEFSLAAPLELVEAPQ
ncbi:MAG TPA: PilN domain-containing protein [Burkholderiales bacterium]|nr:PilN domain-containing protein [Burkholderiales bacterium]